MVGFGEPGLLVAPVGLAVEDEFVGGGLESVDGGLGEEGVGHESQPLDRVSVRRDNCRRLPVALHYQLINVGGVVAVQRLKGKIVEDEEIDAEEFAEFDVMAVVEAAGAEPFEELVGPFEPDGPAAADRRVAEGGGEECLPDADRAEDQCVVGVVDEPERDELVEDDAVVGDRRGVVPVVEAHGRVEAGGPGPEGGGVGVATGDLIGQDDLEELSMG